MLLRRLADAAWLKEGRHTESGRYTAEDWLRVYAEHLEIHARQIESNGAAWQPAPAPHERPPTPLTGQKLASGAR